MASRNEEFFDQSMGGNDRSNQMPTFWARFLGGIVNVFCKIVFRLKVENQEVVRSFIGKKNGAVLVAPHHSYLDVVIMFLSVRPKQWVRIVARDTLFLAGHGILGWIFSRAGAFPIKRDAADRTAIKRAVRMLKNGELVGIFPEGTRRGKGSKPSEIHGGAALIARMGKAPIVPMGLVNLDKVKQQDKGYRLPRITAVFGEPIAVSAFDFLPKDERLEACTWYVMREAFALSAGCSAEEVDMAALFPTGKDYTATFAGVEIPRVDRDALPAYEPKEA